MHIYLNGLGGITLVRREILPPDHLRWLFTAKTRRFCKRGPVAIFISPHGEAETASLTVEEANAKKKQKERPVEKRGGPVFEAHSGIVTYMTSTRIPKNPRSPIKPLRQPRKNQRSVPQDRALGIETKRVLT